MNQGKRSKVAHPAARSVAVKCKKPDVQTQDLDRSLGYSLRRAQISTFAAFSSAMMRYDVRPSQYAVLVLIRANPGMSQSAACACLSIQKANFVTLLDRLEQRGWTERGKGSDRRASVLRLTRSGQVFVRKIEAAHGRMEQRLAARLGDKRTKKLLRLLHDFCETGTGKH
jgi:DNA-binding MarR family transcriptional regulator